MYFVVYKLCNKNVILCIKIVNLLISINRTMLVVVA